jgi:hypothetical protein
VLAHFSKTFNCVANFFLEVGIKKSNFESFHNCKIVKEFNGNLVSMSILKLHPYLAKKRKTTSSSRGYSIALTMFC